MWPPLVSALISHKEKGYLGFHVPGHRQGRGAYLPWRELLGENVFLFDLTELPDLDNLQDPGGVLREAAEAAASFFGARETYFLVNGATGGILAALLALSAPGGCFLLPRYTHQAVIHGAVLSGALPVFLATPFHKDWGLPGFPETRDLASALAAAKPCLLVATHPNYYGLAGDLAAWVEAAHASGAAVLVDEAHGPHFRAGKGFPLPALDAGAEVAVQSAHKVLGAFTQAALLHCGLSLKEPGRLRQALRLLQTSSPSYLLLASLDVARHQFARERGRWSEAVELGLQLRRAISRMPGLFAPGEELSAVPGVVAHDPTRLVVNVRGLGISGFRAARWLFWERRLAVEFADQDHIVLVLGPGDQEVAGVLLEALADLARAFRGRRDVDPRYPELFSLPLPPRVLAPREAFFAPRRAVPLESARGLVAAETISLYPPGVPVVCPGETITPEVLEYLALWEEAGGSWLGQRQRVVQVVAL